MLIVSATPPGGSFIEFLRVDIVAVDDGNSPVTVGPYEIIYTTDGTLPRNGDQWDDGTTYNADDVVQHNIVLWVSNTTNTDSEPKAGNADWTALSSKKRRSPIKQLPIDGPKTLKFFARTTDGLTTTEITSVFFDVTELTAKNEIHTAPETVRNYTLKVENGDIQLTSGGLYDIVYGIDKTKQDVREVILVENIAPNAAIGNRVLPQFGSALNRILGQALPAGFTRGRVQTSIFEALTFLTEIQREEAVPADEQIKQILSVNVQPLDPTTYKYQFSVETVSGLKVTDTGIIGG